MKNMKPAIILALAAATAASAGTVDLIYTGEGAGMEIRIHRDGDFRDTFAGEINHDISNGVGADAILNGSHRTFCPDITQIVATSLTGYDVTDIENIPSAGMGINAMGSQRADAIRALYSFAANDLYAGGLTDAYATAFQLVVWEIVDDFDGTVGSIDVDNGVTAFTATDGMALDMDVLNHIDALSAGMMTALGNGGASFGDVYGLANGERQDQLVLVPAPGAMALLGMGGLLAGRRRR